MRVRKTKNFVDLNIDYVIKLGGSLINDINKAEILAETIATFTEKYNMIIFPGGGPIDNYIEEVDKQFRLNKEIHHQACARAQDQTGLIFANFNPKAYETTNNFAGIREILKKGKIPVLLPSDLIFMLDPFEKSWYISSDSMGAYFSLLLESKSFLILTDVDGIYNKDPKTHPDAKLLREINVNELSNISETSVDNTLSEFLKNAKMNCDILNGNNKDNLVNYMTGVPSIFSRIIY